MRTITQAAEELSVSRTKIYNEIKNLNIETQKEGKNNYLNEDDFKRIKIRIEEQNSSSTQERTKNVLERDRDMIGNNISDREYTDLKERIAFLESEIKNKNEQLKSRDYQINGLIQSNFNLSKALPSPIKESDAVDETATTEIKNEEKESWLKRMFKKK
jgi:hypothetical protein